MDPAADLAALLRPIRWPVPTEAEALLDGLLAFGLGLLGAVALVWLTRLVLARRADPRRERRARLVASRALPPGERLLAQARLATEIPAASSVLRGLSEVAYRPDPAVDLDATDAALARALGI